MKATLLLVSLVLIGFTGCASTQKPKPVAVLDVYVTEEGFFVISEEKSGSSMAVRFNVLEIHRKDN